tara:strand:+ start:761 stop:1183 length:423 start_codon:yes stop_codon:yes gene_type:complete
MIGRENASLLVISLLASIAMFAFVRQEGLKESISTDLQQGEEIYIDNCEICHGRQGSGHNKDDKYDLVNDRSHLLLPNKLLAKSIVINDSCKPSNMHWGGILNEKEIESVIQFIREEFYLAYTPPGFPGSSSPKRGGLRD